MMLFYQIYEQNTKVETQKHVFSFSIVVIIKDTQIRIQICCYFQLLLQDVLQENIKYHFFDN